jgi:endonuclease/exonuclease/phosphatase family metal-dependent hydrolase
VATGAEVVGLQEVDRHWSERSNFVEGGEQRGLLEAVVKVRGVPVRVFNTHLQHNSQVERLAQIDRIRTIVAEGNESVVLVGDGYTYGAATPHARIDYVMTSTTSWPAPRRW